jgi:two-component system LytT family response regulator
MESLTFSFKGRRKSMQSSEKISVIIAEDDPLIRQMLDSYLSSFPQVEILASLSNGVDLLDFVEKEQPSAVFLDIEMPDMDGLTAVTKLRERFPHIFTVFVTAHTKYAAEAYQLDAVDYIVKPVTKERLAKTVNKIQDFLTAKAKLVLSGTSRISIKHNHDVYFINTLDIIFIEKEIRKTVLHTENGKYFTTEPLISIISKLPNNFFRCHKSFIINLNKIEKISPIAERIYEINFYRYQHKASMGRQKMEELCSIMTK